MTFEQPSAGTTQNPFEFAPQKDIQDQFIRRVQGIAPNKPITSEDRNAALLRIGFDDFSRGDFHQFLATFPAAFEESAKKDQNIGTEQRMQEIYTKLCAVIESHPYIQWIVGMAARIDPSHGGVINEDFSIEALTRCLNRFPDPVGLIEMLKSSYTAGQETKINKAMQDALVTFMKIVYGERYRAWVQLNLLTIEAEQHYAKLKTGLADTIDEHPPSLQPSSFSYIPLTDSRQVLGKIAVHGRIGEDAVTPELLREKDLGPLHLIKIDNTRIWASKAYSLPHDRVAVVGYVENGDKIIARSFYLSNSHGVWKYLPMYIEEDGEAKWYDKGFGENSITLPFELQEHLAKISQNIEAQLPPDIAEKIFSRTSRPLHQMMGRNAQATFTVEIEPLPKKLDGHFYRKEGEKHIRPEDVIFYDPEQAPNFSIRLSEGTQQSKLYGTITTEIYPSKNGKLRYLFCTDERGRSWIGSIEIPGPIGSTGLRKKWVDGGALTTPAYEYSKQAGPYGSNLDSKDKYIDVFQRYLSKIPVIKEYVELRLSRAT